MSLSLITLLMLSQLALIVPPPPPPPAPDVHVPPPPPPPPPAVRRPPPPPIPRSQHIVASPTEVQSAPLLDVRARTTTGRRGVGFALGATAALGASIGFQALAHTLVKRRCITGLVVTGESVSDRATLAACIGDEPGAVAAGVGGGITLLAGIGLAAGAGWLRGEYIVKHRENRWRGGRAVGVAMVVLGLAGAIVSQVETQRAQCATPKCYEAQRLLGLVGRSSGGLLVAGGASLLSFDTRLRATGPRYAGLQMHLSPAMLGASLRVQF